MKRQYDLKARIELLVCVTLSLALGGCAVLTSDQKDAVKAFATATTNYGTLPGAALSAYADAYVAAHWTLQVEDLDSADITKPGSDGDKAAQDLTQSLKATWAGLAKNEQYQTEFNQTANKASAAFNILDTYSSLLTKLTSDDFTNDLNSDATALSNSLDNGIKLYNSKAGTNLDPIGSTVAEIVRGAGGIYIRHCQEKALKAAIPPADKMIQTLTTDVAGAMTELDALLTETEKDLSDDFTNDSINSYKHGHGALSYELISAFVAEYEKLEAARHLAVQAGTAAKQFATAHAKLAAAINEPASFKEALAEISTLKVEIQAAQTLKSTLDAAQAKSK